MPKECELTEQQIESILSGGRLWRRRDGASALFFSAVALCHKTFI